MKNKTKLQLTIVLLTVVSLALLYVLNRPPQPPTVTLLPQPLPPQPQPRPQPPEYRDPPIKQYKPGFTQQMGILVGADETLPLYGKEVRGRRDRYHYYTTTNGENLYPLPITHNARDCVDDVGCEELYGNETVSVTGKTGSFTVNLYRTDNFF